MARPKMECRRKGVRIVEAADEHIELVAMAGMTVSERRAAMAAKTARHFPRRMILGWPPARELYVRECELGERQLRGRRCLPARTAVAAAAFNCRAGDPVANGTAQATAFENSVVCDYAVELH